MPLVDLGGQEYFSQAPCRKLPVATLDILFYGWAGWGDPQILTLTQAGSCLMAVRSTRDAYQRSGGLAPPRFLCKPTQHIVQYKDIYKYIYTHMYLKASPLPLGHPMANLMSRSPL